MSKECVILFRNPSNGRVSFIGKSWEPTVFKNTDDASALARTHSVLQRWPFQIVELTELTEL